jgi:hypothetical protein
MTAGAVQVGKTVFPIPICGSLLDLVLDSAAVCSSRPAGEFLLGEVELENHCRAEHAPGDEFCSKDIQTDFIQVVPCRNFEAASGNSTLRKSLNVLICRRAGLVTMVDRKGRFHLPARLASPGKSP